MVPGIRVRLAGRSALLLIIILFATPVGAWAGGGPRDVAVIINSASDVSREIGLYYASARVIPDRNICYITCPEDEVVSWQVCEEKIRKPIRSFLSRPEVAGRIDYIVLTKGVPLAADYVDGMVAGDTNHYYSVESLLLDIEQNIVDLTGPQGVPDGKPDNLASFAFPYGPGGTSLFIDGPPQRAWSHSLFDSGVPGDEYDINKRYYLITRLDAFTAEQVKRCIDRSKQPALDGLYVLDRNTWNTGGYKLANVRLGNQIDSAYDFLVRRGMEVRFDSGSLFLGDLCGLMGYFSWGSNDVLYSYTKYTSNLFVPGAIADTYYSFSGRTFTDPGTSSRSSLIGDLFACGLCGAGGYVSEPNINSATRPDSLFDRYTRGFNMAESFYGSCMNGNWKTVITGDPLMAPYATPPEISLEMDSVTLHDVATIDASCYDESGIGKVLFYFDDELIATDYNYPFAVQIDTNEYPIGPHALEAVAYENSPVATQRAAKAEVIIDNPVSTVPAIRDALAYPNGQHVRLRRKVVTAATSDMGDGFYIEESDRSSAVKVMSTLSVDRGDIVTVIGAVNPGSGERVISNPVVTVEQVGSDVPGPLFIKLCDLGSAPNEHQQYAVGRGRGARNTSLLVRVAGRVSSLCSDGFFLTDASVTVPVKIICRNRPALEVGSWVAVTGLSAAEADGQNYRAAVRTRNASDVQPL